MSTRKKIVFKIENVVIVEETKDLTIDEINNLKNIIAQECECTPDEVEVDTIEAEVEMSTEIDCTSNGLVYWKSLDHKPIKGVSCLLTEGSDKYLDAINDGTIEEFLVFFI